MKSAADKLAEWMWERVFESGADHCYCSIEDFVLAGFQGEHVVTYALHPSGFHRMVHLVPDPWVPSGQIVPAQS